MRRAPRCIDCWCDGSLWSSPAITARADRYALDAVFVGWAKARAKHTNFAASTAERRAHAEGMIAKHLLCMNMRRVGTALHRALGNGRVLDRAFAYPTPCVRLATMSIATPPRRGSGRRGRARSPRRACRTAATSCGTRANDVP